MGINTEKNPRTNLQNSYKNLSKAFKSDNNIGNIEKITIFKG